MNYTKPEIMPLGHAKTLIADASHAVKWGSGFDGAPMKNPPAYDLDE